MTDTKTTGPRNRKDAMSLVTSYLLGHLNGTNLDEMFPAAKHWTDAQVKRVEVALGDVEARLRKLAGDG
jgi:hypothetical protein